MKCVTFSLSLTIFRFSIPMDVCIHEGIWIIGLLTLRQHNKTSFVYFKFFIKFENGRGKPFQFQTTASRGLIYLL